jgi:hypothetical protein
MTSTHHATAASLLGQARAILSGQHPVPRSQVARAAAIITRQALEDSVRELCNGWGITDPRANMRSKLVTMRVLGDETTSELAATAWWGLCNACHHHAYELTPTAAEVRYLIDQVARLTGLVIDSHMGDNGS